ncbi:MAG: tRNA (adenosine(37)-N6)-threonylcarbamoyltransferase complex ATPase subunit type 1 TsaE [Erysipelotrichaceae bacterium]|nr:tRNA (adenosine(37)-N6)-threonylcarbamoyltransferase complex ATPase subunit type 1 TsaE [Erysipelotrichaceae bacterium]MCB9500152.1 tRNA (adenosine(37)-N6)-threonylcarbamoyltransferase complex ATPase subunit type 1 TsaE [Erysipelotrichaceae bacterium]
MEIQIKTHSKEETIKLGKLISGFLSRGSIITLTGDLGAGKTTFTKGVGAGLGIEDDINSPTFNILKCYFHKPLSLYHIDAYRLEDVAPVQKNIGLEEVIEGDGVCLIEWPMFIKEFIPNGSLNVDLHLVANDERLLTFSTNNKGFTGLFEKLEEKYHD